MHDAKEDLLAFAAFRSGTGKKIWSTDSLERLNREIKRPHRRRQWQPVVPDQAVLACRTRGITQQDRS